MIKERTWKEEDFFKSSSDQKILNFEDFYLSTKFKDGKLDEIFILGNTILDFKKLNIVELVFQKMDTNTYIEVFDINQDIYEYDSNIVYLVSLMTVESLHSFKYTDNLNLLTFAFEKESVALLFLSILEDLRYKLKNQRIKELKKDIKEIEKE